MSTCASSVVAVIIVTLTLVSPVTGFPFLYHFRRGAEDTPLDGVMNRLSDRLTRLTTQLQAQLAETTVLKIQLASVTKSVAFTVTFSSPDVRGLHKNQILQFDNVLYNVGNGYSPETGLFTAPETGAYVFYVHVTRHLSDTDRCVVVDLYRGQQQVTTLFACLYNNSSSSLAAVHLARGEAVHVQLRSGTMLSGHAHTSMSGMKL